jgi:hypothetical protein
MNINNLKNRIKYYLEKHHCSLILSIYKYIKNVKLNIDILVSLPIYVFFIKNSKKYLLCRPRGGLNDTLNQLELCCRYSLKHRRKLFIDTNRSGFLDSFENYFLFPSYILTGVMSSIKYPVSVYPLYLQNDIYNYETVCDNDICRLKNGQNLILNFKKNYSEQYLIHESWGGGEDSIYFLKRIKLKKSIQDHITSVINKLDVYTAVHIRNTDMQSDYKQFLNNVNRELIYNNIVICTDDYAVQQYGKDLFGDKLILPSIVPDLKGQSLHDNQNLDRYITNINTITDLFILASSKKLYITKTKKGIYSGFSLLAKSLHEDKRLIKKLLYE